MVKFDGVLEIIITKRNTAPQMARALLVLIKRFFGWCVDQEIYGLSASPCEGLSGKKLIGELQSRDRRLSDDRDIRVLASHRAHGLPGWFGLPHAAAHRVAAERGRADFVAGSSGQHHRHPGIEDEGPRGQGARTSGAAIVGGAGGHCISCRASRTGRSCSPSRPGKRPLAMTGPIKADLDRRMLRTLKAMARRRGEDHQAVDLPGWVNHDLRRVVRSGLSALRVPHNVAEAVLAHRPPGIVGTYNLHEYEDEKAEALEDGRGGLANDRQPACEGA